MRISGLWVAGPRVATILVRACRIMRRRSLTEPRLEIVDAQSRSSPERNSSASLQRPGGTRSAMSPRPKRSSGQSAVITASMPGLLEVLAPGAGGLDVAEVVHDVPVVEARVARRAARCPGAARAPRGRRRNQLMVWAGSTLPVRGRRSIRHGQRWEVPGESVRDRRDRLHREPGGTQAAASAATRWWRSCARPRRRRSCASWAASWSRATCRPTEAIRDGVRGLRLRSSTSPPSTRSGIPNSERDGDARRQRGRHRAGARRRDRRRRAADRLRLDRRRLRQHRTARSSTRPTAATAASSSPATTRPSGSRTRSRSTGSRRARRS